MASIFERPELNKIFLIYGDLDDMFMSPDLQKNNFRVFLNSYLRSIGYERIVFYSGAKNMGKYVLDDKSAVLAINKNKGRNIDEPAQKAGNTAPASDTPAAGNTSADGTAAPDKPKKKRRILTPNVHSQQTGQTAQAAQQTAQPAAAAQTTAQAAQQSANTQAAAQQSVKGSTKLIYRQPKITAEDFLAEAKKMMSDATIKTAIVFPFFQNFATDTSAPLQQYSELLSHLWDEYALVTNENICIFLAPQMTAAQLSGLFDTLAVGNVFRSRFFNEGGTINTGCTLHVGLPNRDEFVYMLEYLRIVGDKGKRLTYGKKDMEQAVSSLMYLSREADRDENRAGYLSAVYDNIVRYMEAQTGDTVPFGENAVKSIYGSTGGSDADPLETLTTTRGWEAVAKRINEIVTDYKLKKERALKNKPKAVEKPRTVCSNERIDVPDDKAAFEYPVPHFVIKGSPGVGKTTVVRLIGQIFYETGILKKGMTIEATSEDLVDRYVGGTANRTRGKIIEAQESVLFVDDAYSLLDKSEDGGNFSKQAIDEIVAAMTNTAQYRFCLIMAGYPEPMDEMLGMNAGLASRFGVSNILTIDDYTPDILEGIFKKNCAKEGYSFDDEVSSLLTLFFTNLYQQRDRANFGNARDAVAIAKDVKMKSSLRDDEARIITKADFGVYGKYFEKHGANSIDEIYAKLDKYVGLDFVKKMFEDVRYELLDAEDCKRRGIAPEVYPDHYIFAGNPGTGKTTVGKMLGEFYHVMGVMGGAETMFVDASELIGSHVGDSAKRINDKIQEAVDHNAVLCIDEAYQIADSAYASEIVGAMMTRMTENAADLKMIFCMYSNRVEDFLKLNAGLARRVRVVNFPDYTPAQLTMIFDKMIEAQGRTINDEAHRLVSLIMEYKYNTRTDSFGNAGDVKNFVNDMRKKLLRRVSNTADPAVNKYEYTKEDIPDDMLGAIKDMISPRTFEDIMRELDEQIGLSEVKDIIYRKREELVYAQKSGRSTYDIMPGYYFFVGNPGTGKSTSAKLFAECLRNLGIVKTDNFYNCTAKDLIGQYVGETDKKTYELLKKSINGVLFIDEAYSLSYADDHGSNTGYKKEALEQLIAFMDDPDHRRRCCIILAGYEKDMQGLYRSNSGMRSRIEEVHFRDYSPEEMYRIFALFCKKSGLKISDGVEQYYTPVFAKMADREYFSNGRTARTVCEKTAANLRRRVVRSENITGEAASTITLEDVLTERECLAIVSDS